MSSQSDLPTRTRSARQALVRRSTRGPLDDDDPLKSESPPSLLSPPLSALTGSAQRLPSLSLSRSNSPPINRPLPSSSSSSSHLPARATPPHSPSPRPDLSILLRPSLYTPLPPSPLPPFQLPTHQPPPSASLSTLVARGFFRHAAIKAASDLCTGAIPASDTAAVLEAFWTRLACLLVLGGGGQADAAAATAVATAAAVAEARPLADIFTRHRGPVSSWAPWGLRVLVQRLAGRGAGDGGRRAVMAWYALAAECRANCGEGGVGEEGKKVWEGRLAEVGVRVAAELMECGELETAVRHLEGLLEGEQDGDKREEVRACAVMLLVRMGDVRRAEKVFLGMSDGADRREVLRGLVAVGKGEYEEARSVFEKLRKDDEKNVLIANNYAICLLYTGRMEEAASVLEKLVDSEVPRSGPLFNLATLYELMTDKAVERKAKLVDRVASRGPEKGGWERAAAEFKL